MATGNVRERKKGVWQLEVVLDMVTDPATGETIRDRKYKTVYAKGKKEAKNELAKFMAELTRDAELHPEKMMFADFVYNEWLPKYARKHLSHTTLASHKLYLDKRIIPAFKNLRVHEVKPMHIINFLHNLEEDGMRLDEGEGKLSPATIYYHYRILNNVFNFAVKCRLIQESPVKGVDRPKEEHEEVAVYSLEEASELLRCLESEGEPLHWQVIIKLAILTGMRRSELYGLEFKHIDYEKRVVKIRQAVTYTKDGGYQVHEIKKGERRSKSREVTIPQTLIGPIKRLEMQRKNERLLFKKDARWEKGKYDFLLCDETGKPFHPQTIRNWWIKFLKRHKLKYVTIHGLRHTSATLLINEGVHAKIISERLGHSDIQVTMNVYGHALKEADQTATDKLDAALGGGGLH